MIDYVKKVTAIMWQGQGALGDIGYQIATQYLNGKMRDDLVERGTHIISLLKALQVRAYHQTLLAAMASASETTRGLVACA